VVMMVRPPLPGVLPRAEVLWVATLSLRLRLLVEEMQPPRPWVLPWVAVPRVGVLGLLPRWRVEEL